MKNQLPPGPRMPALMQTVGYWSRPTAFLERCRARYGQRFTLRLLGKPPTVVLYRPKDVEALFSAPPDVLHPGEGSRLLEPVVGPYSVILLDEDSHLEQRKLMLPAFHGERMQRLAGTMAEVAQREVASWPRDEATAMHPRLQRMTLEIILRTVFGLEPGPRLDRLRKWATEILAFTENPLSITPMTQRWLGGRGPLRRFEEARAQTDELVFELIEERRREDTDADDVLSLLLGARHEDDSPMSPNELRDELMTTLVSGHESLASQLAWACERIARQTPVQKRLLDELDAGSDEAYLTATIQEILRHKSVLPAIEPRLVMRPIEIGGISYPPGVALIPCPYLLHHDPDIYPEPYVFRPERFLDQQPGTYTWIPFGGGRRRCLGASYAMLEMKIVVRSVLERFELRPVRDQAELTSRRSVTISPKDGAQIILRERSRAAAPVAEASEVAVASV